MSGRCFQVNLQTGWGGGEVYTAFFTRALAEQGVVSTLFVHRENLRWGRELPEGTEIVPVADAADMVRQLLARNPGWILCQTPLAPSELELLRQPGRIISCIAHMPLYGRDPRRIAAHDSVIAVSQHVIDSLHAAGVQHVHPEPLLGIADLKPRPAARGTEAGIWRHSRYDWDLRKGRDRLLSWLAPLWMSCRPALAYQKRPGITLAIVSRLTPIKQFPTLFGILAPILAQHPEVNLEIFGAGGYASVRDLDRALRPCRRQVRFWGHQSDVAQVYGQIDYLLTGLPEKEALGLNVIEAQVCGTPILAVNARPFTETVAAEVTGLFFDDPRKDGGASFDALLTRLQVQAFKIDPAEARAHLAQFSADSFATRVGRLCAVMKNKGVLA